MHYPRPPRRPQAYRVRYASRQRAPARPARSTWLFCVFALGLVAAVVAVDTSSRAAAASVAPGTGSAPVPAHGAVHPVAPAAEPHRPAGNAPSAGAAAHEAAPLPTEARTRQGRQLIARLTAYSASVEEDTAWGITRTETRVRPGVVAVDPAVIPLGSSLRIAGLPGIYRAEDTGGGIRGAHLDIYMDSRDAAFEFGLRERALVEVLE